MAAKRTFFLCSTLATLWFASLGFADRLVLRNLEVLDGPTVSVIDEDGVHLDDGSVITWDRIERGRVAESQQARFDALLNELGTDLYRIRQRLTVGDYPGLLAHAEALADRYVGRRSETAYMVWQALMWSRVAVGRREEAVAPYLRCFDHVSQAAAAGRDVELPGNRRLQFDAETGLAGELSPAWFDPLAAERALPEVGRAIGELVTPAPPAARVYYATLAVTAGVPDKAQSARAGLAEDSVLAALVDAQLLLAQGAPDQAAQRLQPHLPDVNRPVRPAALYWLGLAQVAHGAVPRRREGLLNLLTLPAVFGSSEPELAAAGLYVARGTLVDLGDATGSIAVRRELLDRYGQTWHARKLREEDAQAKEHP